MNLEARKIEFVQEFLKVESEDLISRLEKILKKADTKSGQERIEAMTVEEFNSRIDQSMEDSKKGRLIESNELKAEIDKWN